MLRKAFISIFLCGVFFILMFYPVYGKGNETSFTIGSKQYLVEGVINHMDAEPFIDDNGRTMIPFRYLGKALGVPESGIWWCETTQSARMQKFENANTISVKPDDVQFYIDDIPVLQMDTVPVNREGRLFLPARYIAEALGHSIDWDDNAKKIVIGKAGSYNGDRTLSELCAGNNINFIAAKSSETAKKGAVDEGPAIYMETKDGIKVTTSTETTYVTKKVSSNGIMMELECDNFRLDFNSSGKPTILLVTDYSNPDSKYAKAYFDNICDNNDWKKDTYLKSKYIKLIEDIIIRYKQLELERQRGGIKPPKFPF